MKHISHDQKGKEQKFGVELTENEMEMVSGGGSFQKFLRSCPKCNTPNIKIGESCSQCGWTNRPGE